MKQGTFVTGLLGAAENFCGISNAIGGLGLTIGFSTDFSATQSSVRVAMESGRVSASSLYILQLLDNLLWPPSATTLKARRETMSPFIIVKGLLLHRVSRRPDAVFGRRNAQIFDVIENYIRRLALEVFCLLGLGWTVHATRHRHI